MQTTWTSLNIYVRARTCKKRITVKQPLLMIHKLGSSLTVLGINLTQPQLPLLRGLENKHARQELSWYNVSLTFSTKLSIPST